MTTEQITALRAMLRDDSPLTLDQARQAALDATPSLLAERDELLASLKGVIAESDRDTDAYIRARAAIAKAEGR